MNLLNPWLEPLLRKGARVVEDSDRKTLAAPLLLRTIRRLHSLVTRGAHAAPTPQLRRFQGEHNVSLLIEWIDQESGWFLCVGVERRLGEKPYVSLELSGNPKVYSTDNPTDADIQQALHDYFQEWKSK